MDHWDSTRCQVAKRLYGRAVRAALAEWVLERGFDPFYLREAQRAMSDLLGIDAGTAAGQEAHLMCDLGMLRRVPDGRRTYFVPDPSSDHWAAFAAINDALPSVLRDRDSAIQDL